MACREGERKTRKQGENQNVTEEWKGGGVESRRAFIPAQILVCLFFSGINRAIIVTWVFINIWRTCNISWPDKWLMGTVHLSALCKCHMYNLKPLLHGQFCAFHTLPISANGQGLPPLYCHSKDKTHYMYKESNYCLQIELKGRLWKTMQHLRQFSVFFNQRAGDPYSWTSMLKSGLPWGTMGGLFGSD